MLAYPATFTPEDGGFVVTVPDIPEAITEGDSESEALHMAEEALLLALDGYISQGLEIPRPSMLLVNQRLIVLPTMAGLKVELYRMMREQDVTKAELARRLDTLQATASRLLDVFHNSRLDMLDRAFEALGARMDISLRRIA